MKIVAQLNSEDKVMHLVEYQELMKIKYGLMSMRAFLRINQFSDAFFMYRLYPPIRFVIVSVSAAERKGSNYFPMHMDYARKGLGFLYGSLCVAG